MKSKQLCSAIVATLAVLALPRLMGFQDEKLYLTNSIFTFFIWLGLTILICRGWEQVAWCSRRENLLAMLFAFPFSVCMALGSDLDSLEYVTFGDMGRIAAIAAFSVALTVILREVWALLEEMPQAEKAMAERYSRREFWLVSIGFFLCWLPVLLAVYPGFFVYDAQDELNEILTRTFTNHHPLLHVLLLGGTIAAVHKVTGSYNLGIACYMVFQMCAMASVFTYLLSFLKRHQVRRGFRIATFMFFGFFPVIPMYVLCSAKDALFTAALLLFLLQLYELLENGETFWVNRRQPILMWGSIFLLLSMRYNGFYALLMLIPLLLWHFVRLHRRDIGRVLIILGSAIVAYFLCTGLLITLLHADTSEQQEILTVPIMQLTRVYETDADSMSEQDKTLLLEYLPETAMSYYTPKVSDNVKVYFNSEKYSEDADSFWKLWLRTGLSHPATYLNAWLYTSYGFWYPDTVIDVYKGTQRFTYIYEDSSYFGYETELPGTRESFLPWLDSFYRELSLEISFQKFPVLSMLFSPGFLFWVYAYSLVFFWKKREYNRMLLLGLPLLLWLTVLLGPTYVVRYVLIFWFALPLLLVMLFDGRSGMA